MTLAEAGFTGSGCFHFSVNHRRKKKDRRPRTADGLATTIGFFFAMSWEASRALRSSGRRVSEAAEDRSEDLLKDTEEGLKQRLEWGKQSTQIKQH